VLVVVPVVVELLEDAYAQTKLAVFWFRKSFDGCPDEPLSLYASGKCIPKLPVAVFRTKEQRRVYAQATAATKEGR
jgi:hypothetical protein